MASKRKTPEDATGFVHATSPIKRSATNSEYFNATLQTGPKEYQRVVCFSKKMHAQFKTAEEKRSPVKLSNAETAKNWQDDTKQDIKVNSRTIMENLVLPPSYKYKAPLGMTTIDTTVTNFNHHISSMEKRKIDIYGHITKVINEETDQMTRFKTTPIKMKTFALSDQTTSVNLTAWENTIPQIQMNQTYKFTNLSVSDYGTKHLQTTSDTTITPIETMDKPCMNEPEQGELVQIEHALCDSVQSDIIMSCNSCKKPFDNENVSTFQCTTFQCPHCLMRQRVSSILRQVKVKLNVSSHHQVHRVTAYNPVVTDFMQAHDVSHQTPQEIEDFFLGLESFSLTINPKLIVTKLST